MQLGSFSHVPYMPLSVENLVILTEPPSSTTNGVFSLTGVPVTIAFPHYLFNGNSNYLASIDLHTKMNNLTVDFRYGTVTYTYLVI